MPPYFFKVTKDGIGRIKEEIDPALVRTYEEVQDHQEWVRGAMENKQPDNGVIYTLDDLVHLAVDSALGDGVLVSVDLANRDELAGLATRAQTPIDPVN
ncbi:MAG TPA: hypothetical protein VFW77_01915 [Candidatus Saccharimonadales bacterium]|nr:hypothetical protein [Candidatus Saccharimonadales bacterium]